MNFNSLTYLIFLAAVVLIYWVLPHKVRYILLLAASYVFYMCWNVKLILLIVFTTLLTYFSALFIEKTDNKKVKKAYLILTLCCCLGLLVYFKYFNFLYSGIVGLLNAFHCNIQNKIFDIILPVGISFYTFQTLSYVIDVYKGKFTAEKNIGYYALFVSFFPQLVAGPIERPGDLLPQLKSEKKICSDNFTVGFKYLLTGFVRKCCIADFCGIYVDNVFADLGNANSFATLFASFLFLIQIYNDFAGYSEIAMGSAKLLGINLSVNFNFPLLSKSYSEFFRRWHITLNRWFTDYVYIPLGGNRKGKVRKIINVMIVFILCGLWHGANWTFALWGLVAGIMISLETLLSRPVLSLCNKIHLNTESRVISIIRNVLMIFLFSLSCVLFRSQSLADIGIAFKNIFTDIGFSKEYFTSGFASLKMDGEGFIYIITAFVIMCLLKVFYHEDFNNGIKKADAGYIVLTAMTLLLIAFCWIYAISATDSSGFQYFQF